MATADEVGLLAELAEKYPSILGALVGAPTGATIGGFSSDEGEESRGAVGGALLGGALGAGVGSMSNKANRIREILTPTMPQAVGIGGALGGVIGGRYAKAQLAPWIKERLLSSGIKDKPHVVHKEASDMSQNTIQNKEALEKVAMEKEAAERVNAFDFGMEYFLSENGIDKTAFAKKLDVDPKDLAPATIAWLTKQLDEQK